MTFRPMILALAVVSLTALASLAMAQPQGPCPGGWLAGVPKEKQEQVTKIFAEGRQKLYELESRKWAKQAELNALLASPKPDASKIEALAKEIGNQGSLVYQERVALQQRIAKETGVNLPLAEGGPGGCPMVGGGPGGCPMAVGSAGSGPAPLPPCCQTPGQTSGQTSGQTPGQTPAKPGDQPKAQ